MVTNANELTNWSIDLGQFIWNPNLKTFINIPPFRIHVVCSLFPYTYLPCPVSSNRNVTSTLCSRSEGCEAQVTRANMLSAI